MSLINYFFWDGDSRSRRKFFSKGINLILFCLFSLRFVQFLSLRIILLSSLLRDNGSIESNTIFAKIFIWDWLKDVLRSCVLVASSYFAAFALFRFIFIVNDILRDHVNTKFDDEFVKSYFCLRYSVIVWPEKLWSKSLEH